MSCFYFSDFSRAAYLQLQKMPTFSWRCNDCTLPFVPESPSVEPLSSTALMDTRDDEVPELEDISVITPPDLTTDDDPPPMEPMDVEPTPPNATAIVAEPDAELQRPTIPVDLPVEPVEP